MNFFTLLLYFFIGFTLNNLFLRVDEIMKLVHNINEKVNAGCLK